MSVADVFEAALGHAEAKPDALAQVHVAEDGAEHVWTRGDWRRQVSAASALLQAEGVAPGDSVVLGQGHDPSLSASFWATIAVGASPCLVPSPGLIEPALGYARRLSAWVDSVAPRLVLLPPCVEPAAVAGILDVTPCRSLHGVRSEPAPETRLPRGTALLQLSSGTTGAQKVVRIGHDALLGVARATIRALEVGAPDVVVNWLPLHHDLGLFTGLIVPAVAGIPTVLLSARRWARQPAILFDAGQRHRGTLCWMPNFAFEHCARSIRSRDVERIDASGWRLLMNAAEPIRPASLERFARRFGPRGLSRTVLSTGYGLAEHLGATAGTLAAGPVVDRVDREALETRRAAMPARPDDAAAVTLVGCGSPLPGVELRVVDETGRDRPRRGVGEVWLRSPYLFQEYWRRPDLTQAAFCDGWYRTGDLGYLADGELFVCGRLKDLIIVAGRNVHPQDIEDVAGDVLGVRRGRVAAIGVPDESLGTERVALYYEPRGTSPPPDGPRIEAEIRDAVTRALDLVVAEIRAVPKGGIPRTTSGKTARAVLRERHLASTEASRPPSVSATID